MDLILAEQLLLLFLDDDKGSERASWGGDPGLAGALLLDLTAAGALDERDGKLAATPSAALEHPALRAAYAAIAAAEKPRDAKGWVGRLPKELKPLAGTIADRLVERGVLAEEQRKLLGLFPTTRFPQVDPEPERALRERLRAVLLGESHADAAGGDARRAAASPTTSSRKLVPARAPQGGRSSARRSSPRAAPPRRPSTTRSRASRPP